MPLSNLSYQVLCSTYKRMESNLLSFQLSIGLISILSARSFLQRIPPAWMLKCWWITNGSIYNHIAFTSTLLEWINYSNIPIKLHCHVFTWQLLLFKCCKCIVNITTQRNKCLFAGMLVENQSHCFYTNFARVNELQRKTNAFTIVKKPYPYLVCVGKLLTGTVVVL